jgi:small subunit ribosomal protein S19
MSRSAKKGPYIDQRILKKVLKQKQTGDKTVIKTWSRACQIPPEFVGHTFGVHNGKVFINVYVLETMVGHRLGEFSLTRTFRSHGRVVSREISKT